MPSEDSLYKHEGALLNKDIFSSGGVLIMSKNSELTREQIHKLIAHGILLSERDLVSPPAPPSHRNKSDHTRKQMVKAIEQVRDLFQEVKTTKKVPVLDLRDGIVPTILDTAVQPNVIALFHQLEATDDYTFQHTIGVGVIASMIGRWLHLSERDMSTLALAGVLHDIGKMTIPADILNKPGKLTAEEYAIIKKHTVNGYEILRNTVGLSKRVSLVALQHHERMDGSGYPFGIKGPQMDLFSKIVAVADVFHAMTSNRAYHTASPFYEVLLQINNHAYGTLDPGIVHLFVRHMMEGLIGCGVMLTDGNQGEIVMIHANEPISPLIKRESDFVDLRANRELKIHHLC